MNIRWQEVRTLDRFDKVLLLLWEDRLLGELKLVDGEGWYFVDGYGRTHRTAYGENDAKRWAYVQVARELSAVVDHLLNHAGAEA